MSDADQNEIVRVAYKLGADEGRREERERCAKIAEDFASDFSNYDVLSDQGGMIIAAKIRSGK